MPRAICCSTKSAPPEHAHVRVLLDECVPRRLGRELLGHEVATATGEGWAGRRNGDLLRLMVDADFRVFVTVDRNLAYQQNVAVAGVAVIVLHARTNRERDLLPLVPALLAALESAPVGQVTHVAG
jgi:hypothetical protein